MVSHTHEDIDQVFSKVSTQMMKTSVYDMDGKVIKINYHLAVLHNCFYVDLKSIVVINSNHEIVGVKELKQMRDIKGWLTPIINTLEKHSNPHNFHFRRNVNGKAEMFYRNWSSDPWLPEMPNPGLILLSVSSHNYYAQYFLC